MTPVDDSQLPRLAIFYDEASAPVFELVAAARDLCRILWLVGWSRHQPGRRMLSRFGEVMDFDGKSSTEIVDQVVASAPDGVIVFSDSPLLLAAEAACRLGLAFHSPTTSRAFDARRAGPVSGRTQAQVRRRQPRRVPSGNF